MVGTWKNCELLAVWDKSSRTYDGANTHSCMYETRSLEEVLPEETPKVLAWWAERNKKQKAIYKATHKEEIRATARLWNAEHKAELKALKREWNDANRDHVNEYGRKRAKKAKESGTFTCKLCNKPFANKRELKGPPVWRTDLLQTCLVLHAVG